MNEVYKFGKWYLKSTKNALNEKRGYDWFGVETFIFKDFILIPEFNGKTFPFYNRISGRERYLKKIIQFYIETWAHKKFAIHGDFALCNFIFGDRIYLVDWEHFHYTDEKYWGFDIINMLFIHLQYEYRWFGFNYILPRHRRFIHECLLWLGNSDFLEKPFTNASKYIREFMDKDKFILGKQPKKILEKLDRCANS